MAVAQVFGIIEVDPDTDIITWYLYAGKKVLYDGEVSTVEEAYEMIAAAKELTKK